MVSVTKTLHIDPRGESWRLVEPSIQLGAEAMHPSPQDLDTLVSGSLPSEKAAAIAEHMQTCAECKQAIAKMNAAREKTLHLSEQSQPAQSVDDAKTIEQTLVHDPPPAPKQETMSLPSIEDTFSQASRSTTPQPTQIGRFRIIKQLGEGGMGAVYLAEDPELDRKVALKVPFIEGNANTTIADRFRREARALAAIDHPNICSVYEVFPEFIVMAYIEGSGLNEYIRPENPLAIEKVVKLIRKLALALQHAHEGGVIHRDLKPTNIMMNKRNQPIIMDFGLARCEGTTDETLTQQGQIIGTPAYMPPEQVSGQVAEMGPGCDIYSLGVILYEMLTGRRPLNIEGDLLSLVSTVMLEVPDPPSVHRPSIDAELDRIVMRAIEKRVEDRYPTMAEFANALTMYARKMLAQPADPENDKTWVAAPLGTEDLLSIDLASVELPAGPALQLAANPEKSLALADKAEWNRQKVLHRNKKALDELKEQAEIRQRNMIIAGVAGGVGLLLLLVMAIVVYDFMNGRVIVQMADGSELPADVRVTLKSDGEPVAMNRENGWKSGASPGSYLIAVEGGGGKYKYDGEMVRVAHFGRTFVTLAPTTEVASADDTPTNDNDVPSTPTVESDEPNVTPPQSVDAGDIEYGDDELQFVEETLPNASKRRTYTLQPNSEHGKDSMIVKTPENVGDLGPAVTIQTDSNLGDQPALGAASIPFGDDFAISRAFIWFDLSWLDEDEEVETAYLVLDKTDANGLRGDNAIIVARLKDAWQEGEVTWNSQPKMPRAVGKNPSTYERIAASGESDSVYRIDVKAMVNEWRRSPKSNHGVVIRLETEEGKASAMFRSSDHEEQESRPRLVIGTRNSS